MGQCPGAHCSSISTEVNNICKSDGFKGNVVYVQHAGAYCYCKCSCVAVDTLVAVPGGSWKRMGDFLVGDHVLALDDQNKWESRPVAFSDGTGEGDGKAVPYAIFVVLENGTQLIVTADHPFLLPSGKLQVACRLSPQDQLMDEQMQPICIRAIGFGEYVGGIHNISTSTGAPGEALNGHLINTGGVVSGDYYAQLYLVEDKALQEPMIGMPAYNSKHGLDKGREDALLEGAAASLNDSRFVLHQRFQAPRLAASFLPDWMEEAPADKLRPLDDTIPLEIAEYLVSHFRKSYPHIEYHVRWSDNTVNAYAWREGSRKHVALLGGLIRHVAIEIEGLALVLAHEIGHHYGGTPRYPNNPWASCEGQADYWGALVAMREVWFGPDALDKIQAGAEQLYNLFAFGLSQSLSDDDVKSRLSALAGCGHPPAQCRKDTYLAAISLDAKPGCAG